MDANKQEEEEEEVLMVKTLDANSIYKESSRTVSGTKNVSSSLGNECNIKEIENNASGKKTADLSTRALDNNDYNVFATEKEHPEQLEYVNDIYLVEKGDTNTTPDSSDMSNNGREADQDDYLAKECELLASLIEQIKRKTHESKHEGYVTTQSHKR
nr:hypothetical protein [Tanacetum cinerariifolium]